MSDNNPKMHTTKATIRAPNIGKATTNIRQAKATSDPKMGLTC